MKVDKSLKGVWGWKDSVYRQTKHFSMREAARKIYEDVEQIKKKYGLELKTFQPTQK